MASKPWGLTNSQYEDFLAMRRWFRFQRSPDREPTRGHQTRYEHDIAVLLLEDLVSGGTARAAVLRASTSVERQIVDLRGAIDETTSWRLNWTPTDEPTQTTPVLSASATPAEVRLAIESLAAFAPGDVRVEFGRHVRDDAETWNIHRWVIELTGQFSGTEVPLFDPEIVSGSNLAFSVVEGTVVEDTGTTMIVRSVVPVGTPTPLRRGAIAICAWLEGFGWTVHAIEIREVQSVY